MSDLSAWALKQAKTDPGISATSEALARDLEAAKKRIAGLEGRLRDAIGAIRHAAHPVASQWIPVL